MSPRPIHSDLQNTWQETGYNWIGHLVELKTVRGARESDNYCQASQVDVLLLLSSFVFHYFFLLEGI